jgi:two-component system copper resistance phosphate regulon response regulator CusR
MPASPDDDPVLRALDLEIDTSSRTVRRAGRAIALTPREYALLELLARRRGKVATRSVIWECLWGGNPEGPSNVVNVYIGYLRDKIDRGFHPPLIVTCPRRGYMLRGD